MPERMIKLTHETAGLAQYLHVFTLNFNDQAH